MPIYRTIFIVLVISAVEVQHLVLMICEKPLQDMMSLVVELLEATVA
jgi:hypothetical protein